ncbi:MAG: acylphosphatase [Ginsengibacter sp.]
MLTKFLTIKGKVQGVFYRKSARNKAKELDIKGWVKNERNGDVVVLAQGHENQIEEFISWCKQGPEGAKVETVIDEKHNTDQLYSSFEIIH